MDVFSHGTNPFGKRLHVKLQKGQENSEAYTIAPSSRREPCALAIDSA